MSQTRAERRRNERGGATPPRKRDPMIPIYVGLAVVVILIFAGFGISNWIANSNREKAIAFDTQTPTPNPGPTQKPIQVKDLQVIGKPIGIATPDPKNNILSDTKSGGHGQAVDGIPCETMENLAVHVHSHLAILYNGQTAQVPGFIGMAATPAGGCFYWIHTHAPDGIIHIEAGDASAPEGGPYTLGMFFDIWGYPLTNTQVGPLKGPVTAFVNGSQYNGDPRSIPLRAHQSIVLEVGKTVPPPNYLVPKND